MWEEIYHDRDMSNMLEMYESKKLDSYKKKSIMVEA